MDPQLIAARVMSFTATPAIVFTGASAIRRMHASTTSSASWVGPTYGSSLGSLYATEHHASSAKTSSRSSSSRMDESSAPGLSEAEAWRELAKKYQLDTGVLSKSDIATLFPNIAGQCDYCRNQN